MASPIRRNLSLILVLIIPSIILGSCTKDDRDVIFTSGKSKSWLGVNVVGLSEKMLSNMDIKQGVRVTKVYTGSPADEAGIEEDDIIIKYDGKNVNSPEDLVDLVRGTDLGKEVEITYLRNGETKTVGAKIAERRGSSRIRIFKRPRNIPGEALQKTWLGVSTTSLNDQLRAYFDVPEDLGVMVKEVADDSPAEKGGILAGDVIIGVADRKIRSTRDLSRSIQYYNPEEEVDIKLVRDKKEKSVRVKLGAADQNFNFHFFGDTPEHIVIPDLDIEVPEIDPEIHIEIDEKKLEELERRIEDEVQVKTIELKKRIKALEKELKNKIEKVPVKEI